MTSISITLNPELYAKEAIVATLYKYSGKYIVAQELSESNIVVSISAREQGQSIPEDLIQHFHTDLIDQQVRYNVSREFGHIRNLIVEEAFKPINQK